MSKIFGGSKSKQTSQATSQQVSYNQAYNPIAQQFTPLLQEAQKGLADYNAFMAGDTTGFDQYKANTGYDLAESEGFRRLLGGSSAAGTFTSGATGKRLQQYGTDLQQQYANNYLDRLLGRAGIGFQAGSALTSAGGYSSGSSQSTSQGSSSSKPGIGGFLGQVAGGIAKSDRRAKRNIYQIGKLRNGLNLYQYRYLDGDDIIIGVMADEVKDILPEALGPVVDGYQTVNYDMINMKEVV